MISRDILMKFGTVSIQSCWGKCRIGQISKLNEVKKYSDKYIFRK